MTTDPSPLDGLRRAAEDLAGELTGVVPRLVERSREQLAIAWSFADRLPCAGWLGLGAGRDATSGPDLRVVPDAPVDDAPAPSTATSPAPAATTAPAVSEQPPATTRARATAPAKRAPAKRAPAKKAGAKQGAAKQAAAKKPASATRKQAAAKRPAAAAATDDALAIPDYDQLAASQVIPRLESLSATELESIRAYEAAHRARRTILGRVAQLQAG